MNDFLQALGINPVIAGVREDDKLDAALNSPVCAVFLLGGSIFDLPDKVGRIKRSGKRAFVHLDLCEGLKSDAAAVEWLYRRAQPDGLISTKASLLKTASSFHMLTIQRLFVMDSNAVAHGIKLLKNNPPDMVEVLPGLVYKGIEALSRALPCPVIAGGMITEASEVRAALYAGAVAVSTSATALYAHDTFRNGIE